MITVRRSEERRHISNENQTTWMTFDWENMSDPLQGGFGTLKIFNEEIVFPGKGFVLHTHKDMVIVTYVHDGMIIYNSPLEKIGLLGAGNFQQNNATPDVKQYAFDASSSDDAHVFQSGFTPRISALETGDQKKLF